MSYTKPGERKGLAACSVAAVFISFFFHLIQLIILFSFL